jgi:beta-phosphoglucomutase-like phosphatase (HAD superfamily)
MTFVWRTGRAMARQLHQVRAVLFEGNALLAQPVARPAGAPARVVPAPRGAQAVAAVRAAGLPVGVLSARRGGAARSRTRGVDDSLRALVCDALGPFDTWQDCGHAPADRCPCRPPGPRLVLRAAHELGVASHEVAVISDNAPGVKAAQAAGAVGILVASARTFPAERSQAPLVAPDLISAVRAVLGADRSWIPEYAVSDGLHQAP